MRPLRRFRAPVLLALTAAALACGPSDGPQGGPAAAAEGGAPAPATQADAGRAPTLELATSLGVPNAREPLPGLVTAGQPTAEQLAALVGAGYRNVISLRPAVEQGAGWEEAFAAGEGFSFSRIPVAGASGLTREAVEELDRALAAAGGEPTILYCASSNRVGAMLALRAHWLGGASPEEAMALGRAAGMRSLEPAVAQILATPGGGS